MVFLDGCSRRGFLGGLAGISAGWMMGTDSTTSQTVRFLLCSDLHSDYVEDGKQRMETLQAAAKENQVAFVINLGDFVHTTSASCKAWFDGLGTIPCYHAIGNHDIDSESKETFVKGVKMPGRYYAFDAGDYRLFILDGNLTNTRFGIDDEQLAWLRSELDVTRKRCLLFSHESIERMLTNGNEVRMLLEEVNQKADYQKVVAAFAGHNHSNYDMAINGIRYVQINSAAYTWINGLKDQNGVSKTKFLYEKTPYGIVELRPDGVFMKGIQGDYQSPTPADFGCGPIYDGKLTNGQIHDGLYPNYCPFTASINDLAIRF